MQTVFKWLCFRLSALVSRAFDVELLHIAEHFSIPVSEIAVNWHEIPGTVYTGWPKLKYSSSEFGKSWQSFKILL